MSTLRDLVDELLHAKVKAKLFGGDHAPQLGRLRLLDRLGAGAMGTVFAAYDPRLDRKVAVKVLRTTDGSSRVLAEARALAKLAHPNVVAVYDAEELDGLVYIVMELAPGVPLRAWMAQPRPWRDVVRVLREAGAGIAAAHAAGLVHRDIKPDNILVGEDRTRVVDFGLANTHGSADGTSAGTPFYMAPEVLGGAAATAASDQFSFGVTMFEALYRKRPHALVATVNADTLPADASTHGQSDTFVELRSAAARVSEAPRPPGTPVPLWVHTVLVRALAAEPGDRFASVADLVAALGRDRRRRARVFGLASGALVTGAIVGGIAMRGSDAGNPCGGAPTRTAAVWSPAMRARIESVLAGTAWTKATLIAFDQHVDAWQTSYRRVCEATRVRGEQSDTLLDLRMRCLDRSLARFSALTESFDSSNDSLDANARAAAPTAIGELPEPASCETMTSTGDLAVPTDPAERTRASAAEHELDRAWAAFVLGRYKQAREVLAATEPALATLHAPRLLAEQRALASSVEARIGDPAAARTRLDQALLAAADAGAPELEYEIWSRRLRNELFGGDPAKVLEWETIARAAAKRAGREGAEIDGILGEALRKQGNLDAAREHLERALASADRLRPEQRAVIERNLGSVELAAGNATAAIATFTGARDRVLSSLGDHHPDLAGYADKLAAAYAARGKLREALALHDRSLELRVEAFGADDRAVATSLLYRAQTRLEAGDLRGAREDATKARAIREAIYGANSPRIGEVVATLGDILAAGGSRDEAFAYYDHAATLDNRIDLAAQRAEAGVPLPAGSVPAIRPDETLSIDRVAALAALVGQSQPADATALAATLRERYRPELDPLFAYYVGAALLAAGDRAGAATLLGDATKTLGNEPTRTGLLLAIALAQASDDPQAARLAISLYQAMPALERGATYDAMWALSKR